MKLDVEGKHKFIYLCSWICHQGYASELEERVRLGLFKPAKHIKDLSDEDEVRNYFLTTHNKLAYNNKFFFHMFLPYEVRFVNPIELELGTNFDFNMPPEFRTKILKKRSKTKRRMRSLNLCDPLELKPEDVINYHGPVVWVDIK